MTFRTIPIFTPELACPNRCIYCNQYCISGQHGIPGPEEITKKIESYLYTFPKESHIELGFFGGNFTGIDEKTQLNLLQTVQPYIKSDRISSIRISTRPDYINENSLALLKEYGVKTIELGVQSMDRDVLLLSNRGYEPVCVEKTSSLILKSGFDLGLQMMIGLPGDSKEKSIYTAKKIIELGASQTRIYPTLVIEGTKLASLYETYQYTPLSLIEAVDICKELILLFEEHSITILRVGLHPTEQFMKGEGFLAGPFHVSFKELVLSEIWLDLFHEIQFEGNNNLTITVAEKELNYAIGYHAKNKKYLEKQTKYVYFKTDNNLLKRQFGVMYS